MTHTHENWLFPDLPWCAPTNLRSCHYINNKFSRLMSIAMPDSPTPDTPVPATPTATAPAYSSHGSNWSEAKS